MVVRLVFTILCLSAYGLSNAQDDGWIKAKVLDGKSGRPIPFASVKVKRKNAGVVSNLDGYFQLPERYMASGDTLQLSCIGYVDREVPLRDLKRNEVNFIRLKESATMLAATEVVAGRQHRLTANKVVRGAIHNIPYNCPAEPYAYEAYYRDYQRDDSAYVNLNEAVVDIFDSGFQTNDQLSTEISLLEYEKNTDFRRDSTAEIPYDNRENKFIPGAQIGSFGGNELMILRVHDAIRNNKSRSFSFADVLNTDFLKNHVFKFDAPTQRGDVKLHCITIEATASATGPNHRARGKIYIEHGNFAIHKIEYTTYEVQGKKEKLLYDIQLEYSRGEKYMQLNYISFNNLFRIRNPMDFRMTYLTRNREAYALVVSLNHLPDTATVFDPDNYEVIAYGRRIKLREIVFVDSEIFLCLDENKGFNLYEHDSKLRPNLQVKFRNVKDMDGRLLEVPSFIAINQYRELFVHSRNVDNVHPPGPFIQKDKPLSEQAANVSKEVIRKYWMNTPLKARR